MIPFFSEKCASLRYKLAKAGFCQSGATTSLAEKRTGTAMKTPQEQAENALKSLRIRLGPSAIALAQKGDALPLSGSERQQAAHLALEALSASAAERIREELGDALGQTPDGMSYLLDVRGTPVFLADLLLAAFGDGGYL